jgi:hypothetical protein
MRKISSYLKASESTMLLTDKINQFIRDYNLNLKWKGKLTAEAHNANKESVGSR